MAVGGCDYSLSLVNDAKKLIEKEYDIEMAEANSIKTVPKYDVVFSKGVFSYFESDKYMREIIITETNLNGYWNNEYIFNVYMYK